MANSYTHAGLPYPIYNAKYTLLIPYLDADGDPTDPTTPDTEISKDGGSFTDCIEEVTTITGSNGTGYITLTGAEMQCVAAAICGKVASGPKATLAFLQPRVLPVISNGTAQSGGNTAITLASGAPAYDLTGCFVRTTGGTGGGGTNGANNQARMITAYNMSTKEATVFPAWETNPANDTTYDILLSDLSVNNPVNTDVDTLLSRIVGTLASGTHNPQSGDAYSRIGTAGAGLTALGDTRLANLDAAVSSRSTLTAADVWGYATRTLSSFGTLVSDIATAVWGATTRTLSAFAFTVAATVADKTGYSLSSAGVTSVQSGLAKTTDITALNNISVAEILAGETESGLTLKHAMQIITALALKATGGGTSSISFRNYGDTKNRLTMTVDENGNRTAVTISLD